MLLYDNPASMYANKIFWFKYHFITPETPPPRPPRFLKPQGGAEQNRHVPVVRWVRVACQGCQSLSTARRATSHAKVMKVKERLRNFLD